MIEESCIGQEGCREQHITEQTGHLVLEGLRRTLPTNTLSREVLDQLLRPLDLVLHLCHVSLDLLDLADQLPVVAFVLLNILLELLHQPLETSHLFLHDLSLVLQLGDLITKRLDPLVYIGILND